MSDDRGAKARQTVREMNEKRKRDAAERAAKEKRKNGQNIPGDLMR